MSLADLLALLAGHCERFEANVTTSPVGFRNDASFYSNNILRTNAPRVSGH
jgi:hypothetical protein